MNLFLFVLFLKELYYRNYFYQFGIENYNYFLNIIILLKAKMYTKSKRLTAWLKNHQHILRISFNYLLCLNLFIQVRETISKGFIVGHQGIYEDKEYQFTLEKC